jgi:hypothetical protein
LEEGRRVLNTVAAVGAYPENTEELRLIGRALIDALEFRYISYSMPNEKLEVLTKELQRAVGGTLTRVGNQESYQFQTQFWIGAIIGLSEVTPIIPPPSAKKNPDYFVQNGTMYYGIEVKRPSASLGAERALRSAASQLRARNVDGAIVVDVSECIAPGAVEIINGPHREVDRLTCDDAFQEIALRMENIVYDDERRRLKPGFPSATVVVVTANICQWNLSDLRYPKLMRPCRFGAYLRVGQANLAYHRALWLRDILFKGIAAAGHEINHE